MPLLQRPAGPTLPLAVMLYWFATLPWPVRGLIGACIGAPSMVLLTETVRWLLGRGFFQ